MKTFEVPRDVFEEIKLQLEGARDELEEVSRRVSWFCTLVPVRIEDLLAVLKEIETNGRS